MKNAGFDEVRANVAANLNKRFNMGYDAGDIVMTVGAAGAMNCIFRALIETDDEVIASTPAKPDINDEPPLAVNVPILPP